MKYLQLQLRQVQLQLSGESVNHLASMTKHDGYLGPVPAASSASAAGWHFDISLRGFWASGVGGAALQHLRPRQLSVPLRFAAINVRHHATGADFALRRGSAAVFPVRSS
ncbi:hypothetical protein M5D96_001360, partial [Drosophila gunungcola]